MALPKQTQVKNPPSYPPKLPTGTTPQTRTTGSPSTNTLAGMGSQPDYIKQAILGRMTPPGTPSVGVLGPPAPMTIGRPTGPGPHLPFGPAYVPPPVSLSAAVDAANRLNATGTPRTTFTGGGPGGTGQAGGGFYGGGGVPLPNPTIGPGGPLGGFAGGGMDIENEIRDLLLLELGPAERELNRQLQALFEQNDLGTAELGKLQNFGDKAISNAFGLGTTRQDELSAQLADLIGNSNNQRRDAGLTGIENETLSMIDQIQSSNMLNRLSDYQTEGSLAQSDFQGDIASALAELQEATRTGSQDLNAQLADLAQERGTLGSQLRRELSREQFDRGRLTANDAFDQALARSQLEGSNLDRLLTQLGLSEDARQFDLSTAEGRRQFDLSHALDERVARQNEIAAEREAAGPVGPQALRDFMARSGYGPAAAEQFLGLSGSVGGNLEVMNSLLSALNDSSIPDADFRALLSRYGLQNRSSSTASGGSQRAFSVPGMTSAPINRASMQALVDAIGFYFG